MSCPVYKGQTKTFYWKLQIVPLAEGGERLSTVSQWALLGISVFTFGFFSMGTITLTCLHNGIVQFGFQKIHLTEPVYKSAFHIPGIVKLKRNLFKSAFALTSIVKNFVLIGVFEVIFPKTRTCRARDYTTKPSSQDYRAPKVAQEFIFTTYCYSCNTLLCCKF